MNLSTDSRGISEGTGVAVLVVITVVATASVGMTVTLLSNEDTGAYGAQFTFDYSEDLQQLLIFYDSGDPLRAGSIHISGPANDVTWAELEGIEPDTMVEPSNIPTRLSDSNAYGSKVSAEDFVEIRYVPESGDEGESGEDSETEAVVLATWNDPGEGEGEGPVDVPES
jgi:hypothetical protein